jgi:hypothetical protein
MMEEYEMKYLQAKEKLWRLWLEHLRYYQIFELPTINKLIGEQIGNKAVSRVRTRKGDDSPSYPPEEIL